METLSPSSILFVAGIALTYFSFVALNKFASPWLGCIRALVSVALGWVYFIAYGQAVAAISCQTANTAQEMEKLFQGDGAAASFSVLFGWVVPAIVVGLAWLAHALSARAAAGKTGNR